MADRRGISIEGGKSVYAKRERVENGDNLITS